MKWDDENEYIIDVRLDIEGQFIVRAKNRDQAIAIAESNIDFDELEIHSIDFIDKIIATKVKK